MWYENSEEEEVQDEEEELRREKWVTASETSSCMEHALQLLYVTCLRSYDGFRDPAEIRNHAYTYRTYKGNAS